MTPAEKLIQFLVEIISRFSIVWLFKAFFIIGLFLYLAFGVIVVRQVGLMGKTLDGEFNPLLKFIAWIHLLVAVGVFLLALLIL